MIAVKSRVRIGWAFRIMFDTPSVHRDLDGRLSFRQANPANAQAMPDNNYHNYQLLAFNARLKVASKRRLQATQKPASVASVCN
jgi:hypothetical protein